MRTSEKKFFPVGDAQYSLVKGKRWYIEYYVQRSKEVRQRKKCYGNLNRIKDLNDREKEAKRLIAELSSGGWQNAQENKTSSVLVATLNKYRSFYRLKTWQSYSTRVKFFLEWLGRRPDHLVTTEVANDFLIHLLQHRHSNTAYSYRRTLSSLYNKYDQKSNPFAGTFTPSRQSKSLLFFNDDQIAAIKKHLQRHDPALWLAVQVLFYCFVRPGEMRLLELRDFNLQYGFIEVRPEVSKNKKNQKVVIPTPLLEELRKHDAFKFYPGDWHLFGTHGTPGPTPAGKNHFNRMHRQTLDTLKIKGRYAFYSWKHTGVVKAVKAGINIKDLQLQLRHHSLDMVNEYLKNLGVLDSEDLRTRFPTL